MTPCSTRTAKPKYNQDAIYESIDTSLLATVIRPSNHTDPDDELKVFVEMTGEDGDDLVVPLKREVLEGQEREVPKNYAFLTNHLCSVGVKVVAVKKTKEDKNASSVKKTSRTMKKGGIRKMY